jgi:catechol 2,3-dioxygenase-like lactoylglutathione lyase family enzyme
MTIGIEAIDHVQVTVPRAAEEAALHFYGTILGLRRVPKPEGNTRGGAWYQHGDVQVHLSIEEGVAESNHDSRRHVCYRVADLAAAEKALRDAGVEILPDERPVAGWARFYVRDPGGNRLEIAQRV